MVINVLGMHKLWAFKDRIELAGSSIKSVRETDPSVSPPFWRAPGTYIPWIIVAGTYYGKKGKEFWDTTRRSKQIVIELENDKYTKVVVDVENPAKTIREIRSIL